MEQGYYLIQERIIRAGNLPSIIRGLLLERMRRVGSYLICSINRRV